jgi:hypothetical protein
MFARTLPCFKILTLEDKPFLFGTFVPSWKVLRVWFIRTLLYLGVGYLITYIWFKFLTWDKSLSILVLDILLYLSCTYLVCACFFVNKRLRDVVHLEKLIHIRDGAYLLISLVVGVYFFILICLVDDSTKNLAMSALCIPFASSSTHSWFWHMLWVVLWE